MDLKKLLDVIFDTLGASLPYTARLMLAFIRRIVESKIASSVAMPLMAAMDAPNQLKAFVTWLLDLVRQEIAGVPLLNTVYDALADYLSGPVLDLIWDKLVGEGVAVPSDAHARVVGSTPVQAIKIDLEQTKFAAACGC